VCEERRRQRGECERAKERAREQRSESARGREGGRERPCPCLLRARGYSAWQPSVLLLWELDHMCVSRCVSATSRPPKHTPTLRQTSLKHVLTHAHSRARTHTHTCMHAHIRIRAHAGLSGPACLPMFKYACVYVCVCARACVRVCVRACVLACVRACVRACVHIRGAYGRAGHWKQPAA